MLRRELQLLAEDFQQSALDLSPYYEILTDELLAALLRNANLHLKLLILDNCNMITPRILHIIAAQCPNLTSLSTKNLNWTIWSTYGFFRDSSFPSLQTLNIEGCTRLREVYFTAPTLQNINAIVDVIHRLKHKESSLSTPHKISLSINRNTIDTYTVLTTELQVKLRNDTIQSIELDDWGQASKFIDSITLAIARNTSLTKLSMPKKSLSAEEAETFFENLMKNKSLIELNLRGLRIHTNSSTPHKLPIDMRLVNYTQLQKLDLSNNGLYGSDVEKTVRMLKAPSSIKTLNLSDNHLGGNEGLRNLSHVLKVNSSLIEFHLNGSVDERYPTTYLQYTNQFDDLSLIPFFNMLTDQKILPLVSIAGYFTDRTAVAMAKMINRNSVLTTLVLNQHCYLRQYSSSNMLSTELLSYRDTYIYMSNEGAVLIAESLKNNRTLTSLTLHNVLFTSQGFKAFANALEANTTLTSLNLTRFDIRDASRLKVKFTALNDNEIADQQSRIQQYIARNRALLSSLPMQVPVVIHPPFISLEEKQSRVTQTTAVLPPLSSLIKEDMSADVQIKLIIAYCENLANHAKELDRYLGRDEETKGEMEIIQSNRQLQDYYEKLCELIYYIRASQSISTLLVAKQTDLHDLAVSLAAESSKVALNFFPVISGLSFILTAGEQAEHFHHEVIKHRRAINLLSWTKGLGINSEERLIRTFAMKLTLVNQLKIINSETSLNTHTHYSLMQKIVGKGIALSNGGVQFFRELREGHSYTLQQKLALADTLKILDAIAAKTIIPPIRGTEEERVEELLQTMYKFMMNPMKVPQPVINSAPTFSPSPTAA